MPEDLETRTRTSLNPGTKITTLISLALLVPGLHYLMAPTYFAAPGGNINCGTALSGPPSQFAKNICNGSHEVNLWRAIALIAMAVVVGVGGLFFYGLTRTTETRAVRTDGELNDERVQDSARGPRPRKSVRRNENLWDDEEDLPVSSRGPRRAARPKFDDDSDLERRPRQEPRNADERQRPTAPAKKRRRYEDED